MRPNNFLGTLTFCLLMALQKAGKVFFLSNEIDLTLVTFSAPPKMPVKTESLQRWRPNKVLLGLASHCIQRMVNSNGKEDRITEYLESSLENDRLKVACN